MTINLRTVRDADATTVTELIGSIWREYTDQGVIFDPAELPELAALSSYFAARGGVGFIAEAGENLLGLLGVVPGADGRAELVKVYVAAAERGQGIGRQLVAAGEVWARTQHRYDIELWTDTRFTLAHSFYRRLGYQPTGRARDLPDLSRTTEWQFTKRLD